jgi:hypothetical protein
MDNNNIMTSDFETLSEYTTLPVLCIETSKTINKIIFSPPYFSHIKENIRISGTIYENKPNKIIIDSDIKLYFQYKFKRYFLNFNDDFYDENEKEYYNIPIQEETFIKFSIIYCYKGETPDKIKFTKVILTTPTFIT